MTASREPYATSEETRALILAAVAARPGSTRAELRAATGLAASTIAHHVERMVRRGELAASGTGRSRIVGPPPLQSTHKALRLLRDTTCGQVLAELAESPGAGIQDLSRSLDSSRKTIRRVLASLEAEGLVRREAAYRPRFHIASEALESSMGPPTGLGLPTHGPN